MMKTKSAFIIFLILGIVIFPYQITILITNSDLLSSMVPGWNTTIIPGQIISNSIRFFSLAVTVICYWKLSKIFDQILLKNFLIHFSLTIPAVLIGKINLYEIIFSSAFNPEDLTNRILIIVLINTCLNVLFFTGQIIFWRFYFKSKRQFLKI